MSNYTEEEYSRLMLARVNKRKIEPIKDKFVLYAVKREGVIIYVGSGIIGRENHCLSGCSHVYELNKAHFNGEKLETVVIKRFTERSDALAAEKTLIISEKPILNKAYNPDVIIDSKGKFQRDWNDYFRSFPPYKYKAYSHLLGELIKFFGVRNLTSNEGVSLVGLRQHGKVPSRIHSFIRFKVGSQTHTKFKVLYDLFMSKPDYIKIPTNPPKLEEIEE